MADMKIIMPVGTSFLTNLKVRDQIDDRLMAAETIQSCSNCFVKKLNEGNNHPRNFFVDKSKTRGGINGDKNPAEISSLYAFSVQQSLERGLTAVDSKLEVEVVLLHSPDNAGKVCAQGVSDILQTRSYMDTENFSWCPRRVPLQDLDVHDADKFHRAIEKLADTIDQETKDFPGEVFFNISGGYKALGPYLTMMGMALGNRVKVFYLFEESLEVIFLPRYPMAFDLLQWRDWRSLLLPFTMAGLTSPDQQKLLREGLKGTKVECLLQKQNDHGYALNSVGRIMKNLYDDQTRAAVSEFGEGYLLLGRCHDTDDGGQMKSYLARRCIPRWRHLAMGDHIPETVEHGRGHVQRLLELAQQLFSAMSIDLSDEQLFVLIASIWLHDLGHSGNCFTFEGRDGLVQDKNEVSSTQPFHVYGKPDEVRKYHNFLSYELIRREQEFLFPAEERPWDDMAKLIHSVSLACLFHRNRMPVTQAHDKKIRDTRCQVSRCIADFENHGEVIDKFPLVAALLRFLDGAENQQERSGSDSCLDVTNWVIRRQTRAIAASPDFEDDPWLQRMYCFKQEQPGHFVKHGMVRHAFLVSEVADGLQSNGIYGSADKPIIGVYLVTNNQRQNYDEKTVVNKIARDLKKEYDSVGSLLPFRLVMILADEQDGSTSKSQIIFNNDPAYSLQPLNR